MAGTAFEPGIRTHFVSRQTDISTHAASLVELSDGRIRAFWFAGSREGAQDVEIRSAVFDPEKGLWGPETGIATREGTQQGLLRYVKKLGNPVATLAPDGTLWLFYVTVSMGGWAGSSITAVPSRDNGASWGAARRLITSPFLNISTLVKGAPIMFDDGTIGLPVYQEFIGKFGELLRVSDNIRIIDKQRLSSGRSTLQPVVLIIDQKRALALMRHSGSGPKRVIETTTRDAGRHWTQAMPTSLANPDAALSGLVLTDGRMLVVLNNIEDGRDVLSLVVSRDGGSTWQSVYTLEDGRGLDTSLSGYLHSTAELAKRTDASITDGMPYARSAEHNKCDERQCAYEFSYPYVIQAKDGHIHVVYTWNRSFIKHVEFTLAWLDQRMGRIGNSELH